MAALLVLGSYNHDIVLTVPRFPRPGETLFGSGIASFHGGKGSNQAVQAARCGASVAMRACVGRDDAGDAAMALWAAEGINAEDVMRDAQSPTGTAIITVDGAGENQIIVISGANLALAASTQIGAARVVLAQLETPVDATIAAFRAARDAGAITILNAAPASVAPSAVLLGLTDLLVVNLTEAQELTGVMAAPETLAMLLGARYPRGAVVTAGAAGAVWSVSGRAPVVVPAHVVRVVDTTGAGDSFTGALAAALAQGMDMEPALRRASVAAGLACTVAGAAASLARLDAILAAGG